MKSKSLSTAKYLLMLFAAIGSTSLYFGNQVYETNLGLESSVAGAQKKLGDAKKAVSVLNASLAPDGGRLSLDKALASAMLDVYNKRTEYRINVSQARVTNASAGGGVANVEQLAESVPSTKVKSVKVSISGAYADYEGLQGYLRFLSQAHPLALVYLKVDDLAFEVAFRVYGV